MGNDTPRFWVAFGILLLSFAFATIMSVFLTVQAHAEPVLAPPVVNISNDGGGAVSEYYKKYKAYSDAGTEIHFHGLCASACTMVLFTEFTGIKACADEDAIFAFHQPFAQKDGKILRSKRDIREARSLWKTWLEALPFPLHRYLKTIRVPSASEGDEQNVMLLIPASALLPKCSVAVAVS